MRDKINDGHGKRYYQNGTPVNDEPSTKPFDTSSIEAKDRNLVAIVPVKYVGPGEEQKTAKAVYLRQLDVISDFAYSMSVNIDMLQCPIRWGAYEEKYHLVKIVFNDTLEDKLVVDAVVRSPQETADAVQRAESATVTLRMVPFGRLADDVWNTPTNPNDGKVRLFRNVTAETLGATLLDVPTIFMPAARGLQASGYVRTAKGLFYTSATIEVAGIGKNIYEFSQTKDYNAWSAAQVLLILGQIFFTTREIAHFRGGAFEPGYRLNAMHFPNGANDDFARLSGRIPKENGFFDLYVHSTNRGTVAAQLGPDGLIEVADLLTLEKTLKAGGWDGKQAIRLISCRAGDPSLGKQAAAQKMADFFGVKVKAPTQDIILFEDGSYVITNKGNVTPRTKSTGTWNEFGN